MAKKKYSPEDKASALAVVQTSNVRKASRLLGVPRSTLKDWANNKGIEDVSPELIEQKSSELASKFEMIANKLTNAMLDDDKIEKAPLNQLAVAAGIAVDKAQILRNKPSRITKTVSASDERRYEIAVAQLISEAKKKDIVVSREEAIELLEPHMPDIRTVLAIPASGEVH